MVMALDNAKVMFRFDQVTERAAALYQKVFDLVETDEQNHSQESQSLKLENSNRSSQVERNESSRKYHINLFGQHRISACSSNAKQIWR